MSNWQRHQLAFISEFCTDVAHVPGVDNVAADALSRQCDDDAEGHVAIVHAVSHVSVTWLADVDLEEIAAYQPQSPEVGTQNSLELRPLQIPGCARKVWCDTSQSRVRFLMPDSWKQRVFKAIHGLSHPSGRAMLAILSRTFVWEGLRWDVLAWSRQCETCARSKVARHTQQPVLPITTPAETFEHSHVHVVGPYPERSREVVRTHMMDRTTRWPEAVAMADSTVDTCAWQRHLLTSQS